MGGPILTKRCEVHSAARLSARYDSVCGTVISMLAPMNSLTFIEWPHGRDPHPLSIEIDLARFLSTRCFPGKSRQAVVLRVEMEPASLSKRLQSVPTNSTGVGSADLYTTYVVPPTKDGVASIVVNVLMVFLASIWTVLRFHARRLKGQPWYFEDLLCLFALVRLTPSIQLISPGYMFET